MATPKPRPRSPVIYPERDGKPLAETELHAAEIIRTTETLQDWFASRPDAYIWMNMLFYWEEGNPRASVAPDVFVVFGVPKAPPRRIYKLWEERVPPATVFEVTSSSTRLEDQRRKRAVYAAMGVREYFLYDPLGDYLHPPLQGLRLAGDDYEPIAPAADGSLYSETLDLTLILIDGRLRFIDPATGAILPSRTERIEAEAARADTEAARADTEANARRALERRIAELEAQLREREDT